MKCTPNNTQCPLHKELAASDARYQARIKELEEALDKIKKGQSLIGQFGSVYAIASKALSTTTPDTALQKALLEARIDEIGEPQDEKDIDRLKELRAQLAALGE